MSCRWISSTHSVVDVGPREDVNATMLWGNTLDHHCFRANLSLISLQLSYVSESLTHSLVKHAFSPKKSTPPPPFDVLTSYSLCKLQKVKPCIRKRKAFGRAKKYYYFVFRTYHCVDSEPSSLDCVCFSSSCRPGVRTARLLHSICSSSSW